MSVKERSLRCHKKDLHQIEGFFCVVVAELIGPVKSNPVTGNFGDEGLWGRVEYLPQRSQDPLAFMQTTKTAAMKKYV